MALLETLFWLCVGHALGDYSLQTPGMGRDKYRHNKGQTGHDPAIHGPLRTTWPYVLTAHALIHAGAVGVVLDWRFGVAEFIAHWLIDFAKGERLTNVHIDQALHFGCKLLWALIATGV